MMEKYLYRLRWWIVIYFLMAIPISFALPEWLAWENGPIEMLQNVVLLCAILLSLRFYFMREDKEERFWLPVSAYFLILLGRELSWGRVFVMRKMTAHGPVFISMHAIPYQKAIHGSITVFICITVIALLLTLPWKKIFKSIPFPWLVFVVLVLASILAALGDKEMMTHTYVDETIEELMELLVYLLNIYFAVYYHYWLKKISRMRKEE